MAYGGLTQINGHFFAPELVDSGTTDQLRPQTQSIRVILDCRQWSREEILKFNECGRKRRGSTRWDNRP